MWKTKDHCDAVPLINNCTHGSMMEEQMFKAVGASFGQNDYGMWSFVEEVLNEVRKRDNYERKYKRKGKWGLQNVCNLVYYDWPSEIKEKGDLAVLASSSGRCSFWVSYWVHKVFWVV